MRRKTARARLIRGLLTLVVLVGVYGAAYTHGTASVPRTLEDAHWAVKVIFQVEGALILQIPRDLTVGPPLDRHIWARESAPQGLVLWGVIYLEQYAFAVFDKAPDEG